MGIALRPMQGRLKWFLYLNAILKIQRMRRGICCRRLLRRRSVCATRIQSCWRRYRATQDVAIRRREALMARAQLDDAAGPATEEQQQLTERDADLDEALVGSP